MDNIIDKENNCIIGYSSGYTRLVWKIAQKQAIHVQAIKGCIIKQKC